MKRINKWWLAIFLLALFFQPARAQSSTPLVLVLKVDGTIAPAVQEYIQRGIKTAEQRGASLIIIELNTPGGLIGTMTEIVADIRASRVPVVVYVSPRGAMAGSAGTLITLAGHVAVMAPETIIGAAAPVGAQGEDLNETLKAKETEAMRALVRTITENRNPQAVALAEETIEKARAVSASEALAIRLVDFIANDIDDLLAQLDGLEVQTAYGKIILQTASARTDALPMSFIEQLLDILVNPNFVFLLMTIGVQSILIEISSPGGWVAGFIGIVSLTLAGYGLGVLPVNWFGIIFLIMAFVLFILEIKAPAHGALTAAGIGVLIMGALILFNSPGTPEFQRVSVPLVLVTAALTGLVFFVVVGFAIRAQRAPVLIGQESLAGKKGVARSDINPSGQVQAEGELWSADLAEGSKSIRSGERVEIVSVQGVRLKVRKG